MTLSERLEELEELGEAATDGPWEHGNDPTDPDASDAYWVRPVRKGYMPPVADYIHRRANAALITASRAALPALVRFAKAVKQGLADREDKGLALFLIDEAVEALAEGLGDQ